MAEDNEALKVGQIQANHWVRQIVQTRFHIITSVQYITMEDETVIIIIQDHHPVVMLKILSPKSKRCHR